MSRMKINNYSILLIDNCQIEIDKNSQLHNCPEPWLIYKINYTHNFKTICDAVSQAQPKLICYDFDYPHKQGLQQIRQIQSLYPATPIMIFTRIHSEEFVLWALRTRIWDIQIKPIDFQLFFSQISALANNNNVETKPISNELPLCQSDDVLEKMSKKVSQHRTHAAIDCIYKNYSKNIPLKEASKLCRMSPKSFSNQFKIEHGVSFKGFLIRYRIDIAQQLIDSGYHDSITSIAMEVGFNDHSYFTRMFRYHVGETPSQYRNNLRTRKNT